MARRRRAQGGADAILAVAERLIGEHGPESVSLRQIAEAAGLSAPFAVQYHFGNKAGLIKAIMDRHRPQLEAHRHALLEEAIASGKVGDVRTLLHAVYRPIAAMRDEGGRAIYARLVSAVRGREYSELIVPSREEHPHLMLIMGLLQACLPDMPADLFWWRHQNALFFFVNYLVMYEDDGGRQSTLGREAAYEDCFNLVCGIYTTPGPGQGEAGPDA